MQELPEIGEIVIATITKISDHGALHYFSSELYDGVYLHNHRTEYS